MRSLRNIVHGVHETAFEDSLWSPLYFGKSLWTPHGVLMESTRTPHGVHMDSMKTAGNTANGLPLKSMESSWTLHGVLTDSSWTPHGVHGDPVWTPHESSWSPWKRVGECKVLEIVEFQPPLMLFHAVALKII